MDLASIETAVKWVLLVLLAGFIAQFGKRFADRLIEKRRKSKAGPSPPLAPEASLLHRDEEPAAAGKTGFAESPSLPREQEAAGERAEKTAKKAAKTQLKKEKKETKASEKSASRNDR